ncbi:hypothetical protein B0H10DRAFT_2185704 [Mycena sp. CBHHK59/15]|nr:hypothetical protein B0H10DRAFT_2185704 [Mycena sp. CBHHK59/15]
MLAVAVVAAAALALVSSLVVHVRLVLFCFVQNTGCLALPCTAVILRPFMPYRKIHLTWPAGTVTGPVITGSVRPYYGDGVQLYIGRGVRRVPASPIRNVEWINEGDLVHKPVGHVLTPEIWTTIIRSCQELYVRLPAPEFKILTPALSMQDAFTIEI